jgi:endonuclease III
MKISSEYVKAFRSLQNRLRKEFPKPKDKDYETLPESVTELLIVGILATNETYTRAKQAVKKIQEEMVDFNELRVTPTVELAELLEEYLHDAQRGASDLVRTLNSVFLKFDTLDLTYLKEKHKNELSKLFEDIKGCPDHARSVMLLLGFDIPTMPLDDRMVDYLVSVEALPPEVDQSTAKGFIERQLKASEIGVFYWQLRKATEAEDKKRKPKGKKDAD